MAGPFVAYYRVSTDRQGRSGLGLEAQQAAVRSYLGIEAPIAEFTEVETGKRNDRPRLDQALALCRKRKARSEAGSIVPQSGIHRGAHGRQR